jgi:cytochrome c-type biogenesis protein CcmH/NrfF
MSLFLALSLLTSPSRAQASPAAPAGVEADVEEPGVIPGMPPGTPPPIEEVSRISYAIGQKLRCPVCQGLSIGDSTSPAALQMQRRVRDLVAAGYSEEQIQDFFIERYGDWILLDPPAERRNLLIYVGPGLLLGLGLAWAARTVLLWRKEPDDELPSDRGQVPKDKYEERLLAELED